MTNTDWGVDGSGLTLPPFAGPSDPRAVWGPDVPAVLQTYYETQLTGTPNSIVFAELWYPVANIYRYRALVVFSANVAYVVYGYVINDVTVLETQITFYDGVSNYTGDFFGFLNSRSAVAIGRSGVAMIPNVSIFQVQTSHDFQIENRSQGRGLIAYGTSNANSAPIGGEAIALTASSDGAGGSATFHTGRAFKAVVLAGYQASVNNSAQVRMRKTNLAGALLTLIRTPPLTGAGLSETYPFEMIFINSSGADFVGVLVHTLQASAGTVTQNGGANALRSVHVYDIGSAVDYAGFPSL